MYGFRGFQSGLCASLFVEVLRRFQSAALILIEAEIEALKAWEKKRTLADQRAEGNTRLLKSFWFCKCCVEKSQGNSERSKQRDCSRQYNRNYQTLKTHFEPWVTKRNPIGTGNKGGGSQNYPKF